MFTFFLKLWLRPTERYILSNLCFLLKLECGEILSIASLKEECTVEVNGINRMAHSILTWGVGCRLTHYDHLMNFTASFMVHWVYFSLSA